MAETELKEALQLFDDSRNPLEKRRALALLAGISRDKPYSSLWFVPFAALQLPDHTWMCDRWSLLYTPSAQTLEHIRSKPALRRAGVEMTKQYMKGEYSLLELDAGHALLQEKFERVNHEILNHIQRHPIKD